MDIKNQNKYSTFNRMLDILFRTSHVCVISILFGGLFFKVPAYRIVLWAHLAAVTGILLVASEIYHRRYWLYQVRGMLVIIHAGLFAMLYFYPELIIPFLPGALVLGMVGSHLPKRFRCYSVFHRRMLD